MVLMRGHNICFYGTEMVLMRGHNISFHGDVRNFIPKLFLGITFVSFYGEIRNFIPKLFLLPLLI